VTNGGKWLKLMDRVPIVKGSTVLVMVEIMEMSDVVASESQFPVALYEKDNLVPFSNARRRVLSNHQQ
jgi:hypothetical protein